MSFHRIKFAANGDIAVVPDKWYDDGKVYWPKYRNTERVKRAAANSETHEPNWPKYDVMIIRTCANFNLMIILTYLVLDNYKDSCRLMDQYQTGCNTFDLQSEAEQECGLPDKRHRRPVSQPTMVNRSQPFNTNFCPLAPYHGAGPQQHLPNQLPALAFNMRRVTQGTAVPHLPPPPTPTLNLRQTEEPSSSLAFRPTWRGGRMTESIPCSAAEVHILNLLETIKHQQDQLVAKVNFFQQQDEQHPGARR
ncbi:hypothetical protein N1851_032468 [Merluccius polli]|uniref:Uncharacterized protein n=1 Tax=Merluccius polli TaxID=89951 RepID=A0AA47M2U3_MERPO|nr:hypothetical protein N1851_032468 [Merluccius polli]